MTEDQQRQVDFLTSCVAYYERTEDQAQDALDRLNEKITAALAEAEAMQESVAGAESYLALCQNDAEEARLELAAYLEELDSGGSDQAPENLPVAGTGVGASDATIRVEES